MRTILKSQVKPLALFACVIFCCFAATPAGAQETSVTGQVVVSRGEGAKAGDAANVVVWLIPLNGQLPPAQSHQPGPQLVQKNRAFEPHVLALQAGTLVEFPNKDRFLHNVFSLFDGKRFDLGFYEAGSSKSVRFDRPGVSFLFCNIHPEMSAAVVAVSTPYFSVSDAAGRITIANVPDGNYALHVWSEKSLPEQLKQLERKVTISQNDRTLPLIRVVESPNFSLAHKNKYGQDYVPPSSNSYVQP